jgi:medium-chain acyl-[acyl-carrier-protein] hydrolase
MPHEIDVLALQLPGREERMDEPPYCDMPSLTAALLQAMHPYLDRRFALFGHSFGAAVAFDLATRLPRKPSHLFVSAWVPMLAPADAGRTIPVADRDFISWMVRYRGIPDVIANDPDMMNVLLKPMRADVSILESYRPVAPVQLVCPTTILGGAEDPVVRPQDLARWVGYGPAFGPVLFPGGHFYLRESLPDLLDLVISTLNPLLSSSPPRSGQ